MGSKQWGVSRAGQSRRSTSGSVRLVCWASLFLLRRDKGSRSSSISSNCSSSRSSSSSSRSRSLVVLASACHHHHHQLLYPLHSQSRVKSLLRPLHSQSSARSYHHHHQPLCLDQSHRSKNRSRRSLFLLVHHLHPQSRLFHPLPHRPHPLPVSSSSSSSSSSSHPSNHLPRSPHLVRPRLNLSLTNGLWKEGSTRGG